MKVGSYVGSYFGSFSEETRLKLVVLPFFHSPNPSVSMVADPLYFNAFPDTAWLTFVAGKGCDSQFDLISSWSL